MTGMDERVTGFRRYAWALLAYTVGVVLWGAFVRATGSGAGCGGHWPLCNGMVVPRSPTAQTIIEYTHRLMSGLSLVLTGGLVAWAFRVFPKGHRARRFAALAGLFLIVEALLGAGLVLFDYVAHNASAGRAVYMSAHLANTMVLVAMFALTAWSARVPSPPRVGRAIPTYLIAALPVALLISVTGALAALGDTLFPASSLQAGFRQDLAEGSHALLRLRMIHPAAAIAAGIYVAAAAAGVIKRTPATAGKPAMAVVALVFIQFGAGFVNLLLLAPVWMQIIHLLLANLVWIALVMLVAEISVERLSLKDQLPSMP